MTIYLASRYGDAPRLRDVGERLRAFGHKVTSRWVWADRRAGRRFEDIPFEEKAEIALENLDDVRACDVLVLFNDHTPGASRGGKFVELGMAIALDKRLIIVGERSSVFEFLPGASRVVDVEMLLGVFDNWAKTIETDVGPLPTEAGHGK